MPVEGERDDSVDVEGVAELAVAGRGLERESWPRGPWEVEAGRGVVEWGVTVLRVDAEGLVRLLGGTSGAIKGGGRRSSLYTSRRMLESPTIAEGWSAKWVKENSKWARAE